MLGANRRPTSPGAFFKSVTVCYKSRCRAGSRYQESVMELARAPMASGTIVAVTR
jgi:hypothetical protein